MSEELSDLQLRVLRFIRKRRDEYGESVCYLDDILEEVASEELLREEDHFHREMGALEERGHVEMVSAGYRHRGEIRYKCYKITARGLRMLKEGS